MPILAPGGTPGSFLLVRDRLAHLLSVDTDFAGSYTQPIRDLLPTQIGPAEEVVVALMPWEAGIRPGAMGECNALHLYPRFALSIGVYSGPVNRQSEGREGAGQVESARRAWALAHAAIVALWRNRIDPGTPSLWSGLYFGQGDTALVAENDPGRAYYVHIAFEVLRGERNC